MRHNATNEDRRNGARKGGNGKNHKFLAYVVYFRNGILIKSPLSSAGKRKRDTCSVVLAGSEMLMTDPE